MRRVLRASLFATLLLSGWLMTSPVHADTAPTASSTPAAVQIIAPELNVPIPGLKFSSGGKVNPNGTVGIPYIAQYIAAVYQYLLGISVIAAAVMIVYGGFKYVLSANVQSVQDGKEVIKDAITGLIVLIGSYTILQAINPQDIQLKTLDIPMVKPESIPLTTIDSAAFNTASLGAFHPSNSGLCKFELNPYGIPTVDSVLDCGLTLAKEYGIPPCYFITAVNHEAGGTAMVNVIGHDENANQVGGVRVPARLKFMALGVTAKQKTFACNLPCKDASCNDTDWNSTMQILSSKSGDCGITNDDTPIDPKKDDLGLDMTRFTHGFGMMQATFQGSCAQFTKDHCFTPRDMTDPFNQINIGLYIMQQDLQFASKKTGSTNLMDPKTAEWTWCAYASGIGGAWECGSKNKDAAARISETLACNNENPKLSLKNIGYSVCRGDYGTTREECQKTADAIIAANAAATDVKVKKHPLDCAMPCYSYPQLVLQGDGCDPKNNKGKTCPPLTPWAEFRAYVASHAK